MRPSVVSVCLQALGVATAAATRIPGLKKPGVHAYNHPNPELISNATFDQLLDHSDESKGTFKQRYWYDAQFWAGPGSPVFLFNVGEQAADNFTGYLYNGTLPGYYAQTFSGAVIVIEHRYWGQSIPFDTLTAETLQYHNLPQAVYDMTYFAKNVQLDFDTSGGGANAGSAPWVLVGGSYPGALAAWTEALDPGVFWAYHATSAVVEAIYDFYSYTDAVSMAVPANCSNDVRTVVAYLDKMIASGDSDEISKLYNMFGLGSLDHADDFAAQIAAPLWMWQEDEGYVFQFCDWVELESSGGVVSAAHEGGVGLAAALQGYAAFIANSTVCGQEDCSTYDDPGQFNNPQDLTDERQWLWLLCDNPLAWWQTGTSQSNGSGVVSSYLTADHYQRLCPLYFPPTNGYESGSQMGFTTAHLNKYTGGWDASFNRVMFVGGSLDPWLPATVSSKYRDGGPLASTANVPVFIIENGNHVPDLVFELAVDGAMDIINQEIAVMEGWLNDWKTANNA